MAMTAFFKPSTTWVADFRHDGHPRRWFKVFGPGVVEAEESPPPTRPA